MSTKMKRFYNAEGEGGGQLAQEPVTQQATGIPEFSSPEEVTKWYRGLSREDQVKYKDQMLGGQPSDEPTEQKAAPTDEEIPFGFTQEEWAEVPESLRPRLSGVYSEKKDLLSIDLEQVKKGEEFAQDPVIKARLDALKNGKDNLGIDDLRRMISPEELAKLDFVGDSEASYAKLSELLDNGLSSVLSLYSQSINAKIEQERHLTALTQELDKVVEKFGIKDQAELDEFSKWWAEESGQFDIVKLGGVESYQMYLLKTGKAKDLVTASLEKGRQELINNLQEVDKRVGTLPRAAQGGSSADTLAGVNVERLRNDPDYASSLMRLHRNNPETRKKLMELASKA
jgi:hypothetical protein